MRLAQVIGLGLVLAGTSAEAQDLKAQDPGQQKFPQAQVEQGALVYLTYCMPCHGHQMDYPGGSFDLRTFPPGQYARFTAAVTTGKNNMPPWGEVLAPGDLEALWAYVVAGEKQK